MYWWRIPDSNRGPADYDAQPALADLSGYYQIVVDGAGVWRAFRWACNRHRGEQNLVSARLGVKVEPHCWHATWLCATRGRLALLCLTFAVLASV